MGCCTSRQGPATTDPASGISSTPQMVFMGLDSAGKTTLMYRTLIPEWHSIETAMEPTKAFHYEQMHRGKMKIGMWDLSGQLALRRSWSAFYRYVQIWAVVYVINLLDASSERMAENRSNVHQLINEACLKTACIVVVLNTMGTPADTAPLPPAEMVGRLGLYEASAAEGNRIKWFVVDCRSGEHDPQWAEAFRYMLERFHRVLSPPPPPPNRAAKGGGGGG